MFIKCLFSAISFASLTAISLSAVAGGGSGSDYKKIYLCGDSDLSFQVWQKEESSSRYIWIINFQGKSYAGGNYDSFAAYSFSHVTEFKSLEPFKKIFGPGKVILDSEALTATVTAPGIDSSLVNYRVACTDVK